jgi:very-short-patch-repair endonuclease
MSIKTLSPHSTEIDIWLELASGQQLSVRRVTPTLLVLAETLDCAPCDASLVVEIDGERHCRSIKLSRGLSAKRTAARFHPNTDVAPF